MATPDTQIEAIRQRLQAARQGGGQPALDLPWEAMERPSPAAPTAAQAGGRPGANVPASGEGATTALGSTVEALRQRSQQIAGVTPDMTPPAASAPPEPVNASEVQPPTLPPEVRLHLDRMQGQAYKINDLAQQQAVAMATFKQGIDGLAWSLQRHGLTHQWSVEQFARLEAVAVAQVFQGEDGAMVLTQSPVDLFQQERDASHTAQWLRHQGQGNRRASAPAGWQMLGAEPLAALSQLGQALTTTLERRSRLTPLSVLVWLGGGAIARQALDLLLAASPGLWPVLVVLVVGAVAFALYRLMTRPSLDLPFMTRLLLALLGLLLGGYV
jgi:hypothetical protein